MVAMVTPCSIDLWNNKYSLVGSAPPKVHGPHICKTSYLKNDGPFSK